MKSIEELARELVKEIEIRRLDSRLLETFLMTCPQYSALKSSLETPVWPAWFIDQDGDLYRFDAAGEKGARWVSHLKAWSKHGKDFAIADLQTGRYGARPIPTADALAIIEKAKQNDQPSK